MIVGSQRIFCRFCGSMKCRQGELELRSFPYAYVVFVGHAGPTTVFIDRPFWRLQSRRSIQWDVRHRLYIMLRI